MTKEEIIDLFEYLLSQLENPNITLKEHFKRLNSYNKYKIKKGRKY